jgi:hypothetical protein
VDPDPEHWFKFSNIFSLTGQEEEGGMGEGQPFGGGGGLRLPPKQGLIPLSQHRVRAEVRREFIPHPGGLPLAVGDVVLFAELCDCSQGCPFGKFRYWTQCCGSGMFIPDPIFFHPGSSEKNLGILTQNKMVFKL